MPIVIILIVAVIAFFVVKRMVVGSGSSGAGKQPDELYELLEDSPSPKRLKGVLAKMSFTHESPMPDKKPGCYVILTFPSKRAMKEGMEGYEMAYVGRSEKSATAAAARQLGGEGNAKVAKAVKENRRPFALAILNCEDYPMDTDECAAALRKVFGGDDRLVLPAKKRA